MPEDGLVPAVLTKTADIWSIGVMLNPRDN